MPNLRPLIYMAVGAVIVVAVAFGPAHLGPSIRGAMHRFGAGRHQSGRTVADASPEALFAEHRASFDGLAHDLEACKGAGLISIYADGRTMGTLTDSVGCGDAAALARRLSPLDIDWVNIEGRMSGHYQLTFVMKADQEAFRASRSSFDYDPDGQASMGRRKASLDDQGYWQFTRGR